MTQDDLKRFWAKVDRRQPEECWPWTALKVNNGSGQEYGHFRYKRKMVRAHRVSFSITKGPIPFGAVIRHTCDNPLCCNPNHLISGTQKENVQDRYDRGRAVHLRGEEHGMAKLTEEKVREIRKRISNGESRRPLAKEFGVSTFGIGWAVKGWKHVK